MKIVKLFQLASKYLARYRRRYLFLFLSLVFGFTVITIISSQKAGMSESLYWTAQAHYAGDLIAMGYDNNEVGQVFHLSKAEIDAIFKMSQEARLNPSRTVKRTSFMNDAYLFFNGSDAHLKYVTGVDWESEAGYFSKLRYVAAPAQPLTGDDQILISGPVAKKLGIRQGDSLILEVKDKFGQRNTGEFIVAGIVDDTTIFGYFKCYISRASLNGLLGYEPDDCSMVGFFFDDRENIAEKESGLRRGLAREDGVQVAAGMYNRDDFQQQATAQWQGIRVFVLTLAVYLSDVAQLLNAINLLSYFLYILMLIIIFVSALVTYKLILFERAKELATMRAIGFQEKDIALVLALEMVSLVLIALVVGFAVACAVNAVLSLVPFTQIPSFEIFMKDGRLMPLYEVNSMLRNAFAVFCVLVPALGFPAYFSSQGSLPDMLRGKAE
jgi:ABC-type antimicrobial peptide transport system permease subunit